MSLAPGTRLGAYEILGSLGAGGMGEVLRARDTKLGREVALKVLPASFADDAERRARFEREAKTLAALNHPHIAQVYGFEHSTPSTGSGQAGVQALVMELVPGESLAARLARGPLPVREALEIARQIADGLEAAHEKGIVHRDLKPANVQVTPDGVAKVLDFGLAKPGATSGGVGARHASPAPGPAGGSDDDEATITSPAQLTQHGLILGTAAYMSPEQARGQVVDARTDVWAFGALLYELLSGTRAFPGPSVTDTLAQILEREPEWTRLPATTPSSIRALIRRCLQKAPKQRLHEIADARFTIEDALATLPGSSSGVAVDSSGAGVVAAQPSRAVWRHPLSLGLAFLTLGFAGALLWSVTRAPKPAPREPLFLSLMLPPDQELAPGGLAVSPDGRDIVYSAVTEDGPPGPEGNVVRLYHRRVTEPASRPLPDSDNAWTPFFSFDGASVAFISLGDLKLRKLALGGGGPVELASIPWLTIRQGRGSWTSSGSILLGDSTGPVRSVPASGGSPEVVVPRTALEPDENGATHPHALPGGSTLLFVAYTGSAAGRLAAWDGAKRRTLLPDVGQSFRPFGTGHLLYWRRAAGTQTDLCAVRFDSTRAELIGEPVALLSEAGAPAWDLSKSGVLVYRGPAPAGAAAGVRYTWLARGERPAPPEFGPLPRSEVPSFRVSPDGKRVLYNQALSASDRRLVVADLVTRTSRTIAAGPHSWFTWHPDGRRVIYQEGPDSPGGAGMSWKPIDGSASAERLTSSQVWQQPQVVTRDGRFLVYQEGGGIGTRDATATDNYNLWLLPLTPRGEPRPLLRTKANERLADLSPDQRWMAYVSDETGRDEVWVRAFPEGEAAVQVSQEGGTEPLWTPDGQTLYYRDWSGTNLHAVPVTAGAVPQFGTPVVTKGYWSQGLPFGRRYDIDPVSGALLFQNASTSGREIRVVLNFDEVIRQKMAGGK